jgi:hypothetical protein
LPKLEAYKSEWVGGSSGCRPTATISLDYHVSFTKEDEKKNEAYYNYGKGEFITDELPGMSVFQGRQRGFSHLFTTRGLDILVGATIFSTLSQRVAMDHSILRWSGSGATTNMEVQTRGGSANESRSSL